MTSSIADSILQHLAAVDAERRRRQFDLPLYARVSLIKDYQQQRFRKTYADLLTHPRYASAAHFFLDEVYGPSDFSSRDAQFARVVPALVRLFPSEVVSTVDTLAALHALSERFDSRMGECLTGPGIDGASYCLAWQRCGDEAGRELQVALLSKVGRSLDTLTSNPVLRHSLRLMRGPARAAGLAALQTFLESGFDAFRAMRGAEEFLATIVLRERTLSSRLFELAPERASAFAELP